MNDFIISIKLQNMLFDLKVIANSATQSVNSLSISDLEDIIEIRTRLKQIIDNIREKSNDRTIPNN